MGGLTLRGTAINTALLIGLCLLLVLAIVAAGAVLLKRLWDEQTELSARIAALETSRTEDTNGSSIQLLDEARRPQRSTTLLELGEPAPDVRFLDITGQAESLADFHGQDTTVVFWDGTVKACREILLGLASVEGRPHGALAGLLLVVPISSAGNQVIKLRAPVVIDRDGSVARAFGVEAWPSAVLVDSRGRIASAVVTGPEQTVALASGTLPHVRSVIRWAGLDIDMTPGVWIPNAATESLAETAVEVAREVGARVIADVRTACGGAAVFLARNLPDARILATDPSRDVLALAQRTAERYRVADRMTLLEGELLEPLTERPDLVAVNYLYQDEEDEPSRAGTSVRADTETTQLAPYIQILSQLAEHGWTVPLVLAVDPRRSQDIQQLLRDRFPVGDVRVAPSYLGVASVIVCVPEAVPARVTGTDDRNDTGG